MMSKEAKIGLAVIGCLLIVLGGVATWRLWPKKSIAQAADEKKEQTGPAEAFAGSAEAGSNEPRPRHGRPKENAKILSPAEGSGESPKNLDGQRDPFNIAAGMQNRKHGGEKAIPLGPPPSMMPNPPTPDGADSRDLHPSKRGAMVHNPYLPKEPPAEAVAGAEASSSDDPMNSLASGQNQAQAGDGSDIGPPPDVTQEPAPPEDIRQRRHPGPSSYVHNASAINDGNPPDQRPAMRRPYEPQPREDGFNRQHRGMYGNSSLAGMRGDGTYEVQPNDTLWSICEKKYKTGAYYKALEEANRGKVADGQLKVGQTLVLPEASELEKKYPNLCPKANHRDVLVQNKNRNDIRQVSSRNYGNSRTYTVAEGDTLFDIARYELGKASRWAEIYDLNQEALGKDYDYLVPGTQLVLPQDAPSHADPVTQRPVRDVKRY
jgi:nucleoid-associated protein YgaU